MSKSTLVFTLVLALIAASPVFGLVSPFSQVDVAGGWSSTAMRSSRSSYGTVDSSGPSWNGQDWYWDEDRPSWDQKFAENRGRQQRRDERRMRRQEERFYGRRPRYERRYMRDRELSDYDDYDRYYYDDNRYNDIDYYDRDDAPRRRDRAPLVRYSDVNRGRSRSIWSAYRDGRETEYGDYRGRQIPQSMASDYESARQQSSSLGRKEDIYGGFLRTYTFDPALASVEVEVYSEGTPINAVVELWRGPGDVKTIAQIYSEDCYTKPFSAVVETPGYENTIAIRNIGPEDYPIQARVSVYRTDEESSYDYDRSRRSYRNSDRRWY